MLQNPIGPSHQKLYRTLDLLLYLLPFSLLITRLSLSHAQPFLQSIFVVYSDLFLSSMSAFLAESALFWSPILALQISLDLPISSSHAYDQSLFLAQSLPTLSPPLLHSISLFLSLCISSPSTDSSPFSLL